MRTRSDGPHPDSSSGSAELVNRLKQLVETLPADRKEALRRWAQASFVDGAIASRHRTPVTIDVTDSTPPSVVPVHLSTPVERASLQETATPDTGFDVLASRQSKLIDGRYSLLEKVGEGAYSTVYRAKDTRLNTFVAVKLLRVELTTQSGTRTELGRLFSREAQTQAALTHPNIARVSDANVSESGQPYIVAEFLEGELLSSLLQKRRPQELPKVADLLKQLCAAVQYAHDERVVHRDLKPGNLMLVEQHGKSVLKVLDFGLAAMVDQANRAMTRRSTIGTPAYMPPEEWQGRGATPSCDVYAIGIILYEMLTGRLPFESEDNAELKRQHCSERPPDPGKWNSRLPRAVADVALQAIEKDPRRRPASAWDLFLAFEAAVAEGAAADKTTRPNRRLAKWASVAAAAALVACIVLVYPMIRPNGGDAPKDPTKSSGTSGSTGSTTGDNKPSGDLADSMKSIQAEPARWSAFLKLAQEKLGTTLSAEDQTLAKNLQEASVGAAIQECDRHRADAKSSGVQQANQHFEAAYRGAQDLKKFDDGSGVYEPVRSLTDQVIDDWLAYGSRLVQKEDADGVQAVADQIRKVRQTSRADDLAAKARVLIAERNRMQQDSAASSLAKRVADARARAQAGDWDGVRKAAEALSGDNLTDADRASMAAFEVLRKVNDVSNDPAAVLTLVADSNWAALAADSWERQELEASGRKAGEDLLTRAQMSVADSLRALKFDGRFFARWSQSYLGRVSSGDEFKTILAAIREIPESERDGWAWASLAECLLRRPALVVTEKDEKDALDAANRESVNDIGRFGHFARGLAQAAERKLSEARGEFGKAFDVLDPTQEPWQNSSRRTLAAAVFFDAAQTAEKATEPNWSDVFTDYEACVRLNPDSKYRVALARAAVKVKKYDVAESTTDALLAEGSFEKLADPYGIMVQNATSRRLSGKLSPAMDRYGEMIEARRAKRFSSVDVVQFFRDVLAPATEVAGEAIKQSPDDRRLGAKVAAIYASRARYLDENRYADWGGLLEEKEALRACAAAWESAIKYHPSADRAKAEYHTRHGFVLREIPPVRVTDIQADAKGAKAADPDYAGGYALEAYLLTETGQRQFSPGRDATASIAKFEESIRVFQVAIDAAQNELKDDPSNKKLLRDYYTSRSNAHVWLANSVSKRYKDRMDAALAGAVEDARKAIELDDTNAESWATLGNALEDTAWVVLGDDRSRFPEAIAAFQKQIDNSETSPSGYSNLGRCIVKWFQDSNGAESKLEDAIGPLEKAIQLAPDHSEAHYWLGKVILTQDPGNAGRQRAIEHYAATIANSRGAGRPWVPSINKDMGGLSAAWAAWKAIFARAIPAEAKDIRAQHVAAIAIRAEIYPYFPQESKAELAGNSPPVIFDALGAADRAEDDATKAYAHRFVARLMAKVAIDNPSKRATYRPLIIQHYARSIQCDAEIADQWESAQQLAILLEEDGTSKYSQAKTANTGKKALFDQSYKLLQEAESRLKFALPRAPENETQRIKVQLDGVQKKLSDAKKDLDAA
jgi:serine/threonine protein kinase